MTASEVFRRAMILKLIVLCLFNSFYCVRSQLVKHVGSACIGKDNVTGTCLNLYKCPSAVVTYLYYNIGNNNVPDLPEVCTYEGAEPVVCCTDCFIDEKKHSKGYILDRFKSLVNLRDGPPAKAVCTKNFKDLPFPCNGEDIVGVNKYLVDNKTCHELTMYGYFAVGGRDAKKREFPHMALLGYGEDSNAAQWLCGGTVISPNYILTAAHCSSAPLLGPVTFAATGILKRTDPINQWQINAIAEIIAHPEYKSPSKYHDIALLRVEGLIRFSKDVLPACVQTLNYTYDSVQGVGWGRLGHRNALADTLQVIDLIKFEDDKCGQLFPPHRHMKNGFDPATQTCYGNPYMTVDTCEGDSGGPIHIEYHNCQYTVTGVTSFGKDCGIKGGAGIYTRVQYYVPWIESVVWPNVKEPYDTGF